MTVPIRSVTVYCSSSTQVPSVYFRAAEQLGLAMAGLRWTLVYGGNRIGLMGALADAVRLAGGQVVGITPQIFIDKGSGDDRCSELVIANDMRHRKAIMEQRGDAFIAMPGGLGTFEEVFEIIVGRSLGYHAKPIVLLNVANYFGPLLTMIEHGIEQAFIKPNARNLFRLCPGVPEAVEYLREYRPPAPADGDPSLVSAED